MSIWPRHPQLVLLSNLGIGPEKKKRAPAATVAPRKNDAEKAQSSKAKNMRGEKKVVRKPKAEPKDIADIPPSNPDDPIELESSPEHLLKPKAGKRKQTDTEAEGKPAKKVLRKKITRRGNLDAFLRNRFLPEKTAEAGNPEIENPVETEKVISPEVTGADVGHPKSPEVVARDPEKGKSAQEIPATTSPSATCGSMPENVGRNPSGDQGSSIQDDENSPICPDETLGDYYYTCYSEKQEDEVQAPVWKSKKGDTFSGWHVCRDWASS
ncbi:hypothetical protein Hanom_Chr04g00338441 [Helianthus anomalus]